jgi:hypothetical protein
MSPFRWDVLAVAFVLAVPVLALGWRGDMALDVVVSRLPWCLLAGWGVVALLRWASRPRGVHVEETPDDAIHSASDTEPTLAP